MATQRITLVKIGGKAADVVVSQLRAWSAARRTDLGDEWSSEQWPPGPCGGRQMSLHIGSGRTPGRTSNSLR